MGEKNYFSWRLSAGLKAPPPLTEVRGFHAGCVGEAAMKRGKAAANAGEKQIPHPHSQKARLGFGMTRQKTEDRAKSLSGQYWPLGRLRGRRGRSGMEVGPKLSSAGEKR